MRLRAGLIAAILALAAPCAAAWESQSLYNIGAVWHDQEGRTTKLDAFAGSPIVIVMFYAGCKTVCPMTVAQLQVLETKLPPKARQRVQFVLVSLDPAHDTPERLQRFSSERHLDKSRWHLLTGAGEDVRSLAAALDVRYRTSSNGEIAHDAAIFVLDGEGVVQQRLANVSEVRQQLVALLDSL